MFFGRYFSGSSKLPEEKQRSDLAREKINKDIKKGTQDGNIHRQFRGQKFNPDPADPYKGMTREQRLIARSYESKRKGKSSGKTIDSLLKKIQKRMKKSFCNVKPGCTQYPTLETKEMLKDFYDQLKSMNTLIKKVNKSKEMCKSVPADRKKSGMCNQKISQNLFLKS